MRKIFILLFLSVAFSAIINNSSHANNTRLRFSKKTVNLEETSLLAKEISESNGISKLSSFLKGVFKPAIKETEELPKEIPTINGNHDTVPKIEKPIEKPVMTITVQGEIPTNIPTEPEPTRKLKHTVANVAGGAIGGGVAVEEMSGSSGTGAVPIENDILPINNNDEALSNVGKLIGNGISPQSPQVTTPPVSMGDIMAPDDEKNAQMNLLIEQGNIVIGAVGIVSGLVELISGVMTTSYQTFTSTYTLSSQFPSDIQNMGVIISTIIPSNQLTSTITVYQASITPPIETTISSYYINHFSKTK